MTYLLIPDTDETFFMNDGLLTCKAGLDCKDCVLRNTKYCNRSIKPSSVRYDCLNGAFVKAEVRYDI